jgi:hypothetical protein
VRARLEQAAWAIALAVVSTVGLVPALAPVPAAAAGPGLTLVGAATYDVLPEEGRVAVTVQLTATNNLKDTSTKRFFFKVGYVTVIGGTSNFAIIGKSAKAKVAVSSTTDAYTNLKLDFGADLAAGKSTTLTLTFDIRDPGGAPDRPIRISPSLVTFVAWAVATPDTQGATVSVRLPEGYTVTVGGGPLTGPVPDTTGHELWTSPPLSAPLEYVADIAADRPSDYEETTLTVPLQSGEATVLLRSWPDDPAWRDRVDSLVRRALPILEREIGVAWPVSGPLAVHEALVRSTDGYSGVFDPAQGSMEIAYGASDRVILHELAHAWFNGNLVAERWAAEGFAAYYAEVAARSLGLDPVAPETTDEASPAAIPLNAWRPSGSEAPDSETWAYGASQELARSIAERAGPDAMRTVWSNAARRIGAYQPDPTANEPDTATPDWRGLLDLLESDTGTDFTDLWRRWVARPADLAALSDRDAARSSYARSVELAMPWRLPPAPRLAMRAWRFDIAGELLLAADAVIAQRDRLEQSAAAAELTLPNALQATFEDAGIASAAAEAEREQSVVDAIAAAQAARPSEPGAAEQAIVAVGLLSEDPEVRLRDATAALAAGDLEGAYEAATEATAAWSSAAALGRSRIVSAALLVVAFLLVLGIIRQRRRAGRREPG